MEAHMQRWVLGLLLLVPVEGAVRIVTQALPPATAWRGYVTRVDVAIVAPCLAADTYLSADGLPEGFRLSPVGVLEGFPKRTGEYLILVSARNPCGAASRDMVLRIFPAALWEVHPGEIVIEIAERSPPVRRKLSIRSTRRDMAYRIDVEPSPPPWLKVTPRLGFVPPEGSPTDGDSVEVEVNATKLARGVYQAVLRIFAAEALRTERVPVTLKVVAGP